MRLQLVIEELDNMEYDPKAMILYDETFIETMTPEFLLDCWQNKVILIPIRSGSLAQLNEANNVGDPKGT